MTPAHRMTRTRTLTRRDALRLAGWSCVAFPLAGASPVFAAQPQAKSDAKPQPELMSLNRFPRMVHEHFVARVRAGEQAAAKVIDGLDSKTDAEAYVRSVQEKIATCFGPFPAKTPLNARTTGIIERDGYRIEKVIFESRPNFLVTANVYVPTGRKFPLPAVVGTCGHSTNGKASETYQSFAQGLARMGYVCLIFDPIGQGERLQYGHVDSNIRPRVGVGEHLYAGNQQFLVGEFFGTWRAWDGIRALDYLLSRPEVDPQHVGVTGNSGGGTMTTWLCGLERRWTMAAPQCFVTTFRRNLENELPADTEQCPPKALALGLDHADFLAAMAPKPVIVLAGESDFFDVRGTEEAFARLQRLYRLLGAEENVKLVVAAHPHGYFLESREAMYQWFNHATRISDATKEPPLVIEKDETLWCTPTGQVAEMSSRTVFSFTHEKAQKLSQGRPSLTGNNLREALTAALKLPQRSGVPDFRILRPSPGRRYPPPYATTYAVETEPRMHAIVYRLSERPHSSRPPRSSGRAILYIAHHSSDAELRDEPLLGELLRNEPRSTLFTCDVRGIGESRPDTCGADMFLSPYGSDYLYAIHSVMLDYPYVGQRTFDVLRVVDWLTSFGHEQVHLVGKGWGAIPATFAAVLSDAVTQVTLKGALDSYQAIAESEQYTWPLSVMLPEVLEKFDLPDCYRALASKNVRRIDSWGPSAGGVAAR